MLKTGGTLVGQSQFDIESISLISRNVPLGFPNSNGLRSDFLVEWKTKLLVMLTQRDFFPFLPFSASLGASGGGGGEGGQGD